VQLNKSDADRWFRSLGTGTRQVWSILYRFHSGTERTLIVTKGAVARQLQYATWPLGAALPLAIADAGMSDGHTDLQSLQPGWAGSGREPLQQILKTQLTSRDGGQTGVRRPAYNGYRLSGTTLPYERCLPSLSAACTLMASSSPTNGFLIIRASPISSSAALST
jgi:hypothetical protein